MTRIQILDEAARIALYVYLHLIKDINSLAVIDIG